MSADHATRMDSSLRAKSNYQKLPGSSLWVMTREAVVESLRERFGPHPANQPLYIPNGNEQRILADLVRQGIPAVLAGPPGIGKMTLVRAVFHRLGYPLQTFIASSATPLHQLLGKQGAAGRDAEMATWIDGGLSLAARAADAGLVNGFYLDELIRLPGEMTSYFFSVIDGRQTLAMPTGEELETKGNLKLVFSYNPAADARLDEALRSRLVAIRLSYPASDVEAEVLTNESIGGLQRVARGREIAEGLIKFSNIIRRSHGYEVDLDFPPLSDKETGLLRLLQAPPSTRLLVVASRMMALGKYGSIDAVNCFILPSLLQDAHHVDVPLLGKLLAQMVEALVPKTESRRRMMEEEVETLFDEHESRRRDSKETPAPTRTVQSWSVPKST